MVTLSTTARPSALVIGSFQPGRVDHVLHAAKVFKRRIDVLSPVDLHVVKAPGEFKLLVGDKEVTASELQDDVLAKMQGDNKASFVYLANGPDGYLGRSATGEIFAARLANIPVFAQSKPTDPICDHYIDAYYSPETVLERYFGEGSIAAAAKPLGFVAVDLSNTLVLDQRALTSSVLEMQRILLERRERRAGEQGRRFRPPQKSFQELFYTAERTAFDVLGHGQNATMLALGFAMGRRAPQRGIENLLNRALPYMDHIRGDEVRLVDEAADVLAQISARNLRLGVVARGRPTVEYRRIVQTGLLELFASIAVVPEKSEEMFRALATEQGLEPKRCWMVGNSLRADINPALRAGWNAIHVPQNNNDGMMPKTRLLSGYMDRRRILEPWGELPVFQRVRSFAQVANALPIMPLGL